VAEKDTKKKTAAKPTPAAKKTTAAKATAAKKPAAPAKRTVARPVTRVAKAPVAARPRATKEERDARPKREKVAPKALPTAAAGSAPLISADGSSAGSVALPDVIAHPARRSTVLFQALLASRANARQANAATKNRARVAGGGAKPWRQKGTGRARQGSTRSPLWRHGGVVFGPNGRRYEQRMPEKMRRAAFAEALSERAAAGRVLVFEELRLEGDRPRTRDAAKWLANIGDTGRTMLVSAVIDERVGRAVANLPHVELRTPGTLRLSDVLSADTLLVNRPALDALAARAAVRAASA
jgi:large subunit ribosomal protein L4